ncbi:unnamed protein product [Polarella glacialis]|uniref:SET domain-containing protein n=1 Tax=Polarella glacialis TaxID=89957 RepID=A0A813GUK0_POLGL|nr:unnamed protein product [Polarella glacialis]
MGLGDSLDEEDDVPQLQNRVVDERLFSRICSESGEGGVEVGEGLFSEISTLVSELAGQDSAEDQLTTSPAFLLVPAGSRAAVTARVARYLLAPSCKGVELEVQRCTPASVRWLSADLANELQQSGAELWTTSSQPPSLSNNTTRSGLFFGLVIDLGVFDSLASRAGAGFCKAVLGLLRPGGLFLCISDEPEAYGPLRSRMRELRPEAEPRLAVRTVEEEGLSLHAFRKASASSSEASAASQAQAQAPPGGKCRGKDTLPGMFEDATRHASLIQPARPNINPEEACRAAFAAAQVRGGTSNNNNHNNHNSTTVPERTGQQAAQQVFEPPDSAPGTEHLEWLSESVDLVLVRDRGRALVARTHIAAGDLLFVCSSVFMASAEQLGMSVLNWLQNPQASTRDKQQFYALFDGNNGSDLPPMALFRPGEGQEQAHKLASVPQPPAKPDMEQVYRILALNGLQADQLQSAAEADAGRQGVADLLGSAARRRLPGGAAPAPEEEEEGSAGQRVSGVWPLFALMNHACTPSVLAVPLSGKLLAFVAACELPVGAELTTRYVRLATTPQPRREELRAQKDSPLVSHLPSTAAELSNYLGAADMAEALKGG